jgi:peptidoglycan/LPS O-acetylase OafA/YrhL
MANQTHRYRSEIDGLRTVAVLPVLLFHAGIGPFSGGFVGVDVFFVISGYLITLIIWNEIEGERFSIGRFYERRARRILPALYTVLLVSAILAWFLMLPEQLENFGQSVVATVLFANNMLLMLTAGYWDLSVDFKPLVHTWSLAVEEQFYIAFPLLLLLAARWMKRETIVWLLIAVLVASLASTLVVHRWNSNANFYLVVTRAWELLAGAIVAMTVRDRTLAFGNQAFSLAGLGLIIASIFLLDETSVFPGPAAVLPVGGAVLVILFTRPGTLTHRLLSLPIMVGIGLISYSLYLWHQPMMAFARIFSREEPGQLVFAGAIVASFILAWLTWKFVEQPFRDRAKVGTLGIVVTSLIGTAVLLAVGLAFHFNNGFPGRLYRADGAAPVGEYIEYNTQVFALKTPKFADGPEPKILVTGNSFARDFSNVLIERFGADALNLVYRDDLTDCFDAVRDPVLEGLLTTADIVIVGSGTATNECIAKDIALLQGRRQEIFYVGSKDFGVNLNWIMRMSQENMASLSNRPRPEWLTFERTLAKSIPEQNYLSIYNALRVGDTMPVTDSRGHLVSSDTIHLTKAGAQLVGQRLLPGSRLEATVRDTQSAASLPRTARSAN